MSNPAFSSHASSRVADFLRPVVVFGLIGQSNADGVNCRYREMEDPLMPGADGFSGCYIFDKVAREDRLRLDGVGEVRRLTPGFTHGKLKPWSDPNNDYFGPELSLAFDYHRALGHTVVVIKLAIGGSRVGNGEFHTWNVAAHAKFGLLDPYIMGYWEPTMRWLKARARDVRVGGMVSMVGGSDARREVDAMAYASNMADIIRNLSDRVKPEEMGTLPWLVIKTPRITDNGKVIGFLDEIRKGQDRMAALPGVTVEELVISSFHAKDPIHLDTKGVIAAGRQMAAWAHRQI